LKRAVSIAIFLAACSRPEAPAQPKPIGDAAKGKVAIDKYGCTACHLIPGVEGQHGMLAPSLDHVGSRPVIARKLKNEPQAMAAYIENPQASDPANTMPNLGVTPADARDIAAFLSALK
jgi:cytochrome c2